MANEIQFSYAHGATTYFLVLEQLSGFVWSYSGTGGFGAYLTAAYANYVTSATERGTASHIYEGSFPSACPAGIYSIDARAQQGGSPAETDPTVATGDFQWNGSTVVPLTALATSGQIAAIGPTKIFKGQMIQNFKFALVSSLDHVTPFTSGVCSGQISRGSGAFGVLQSGAFFETGLGFYQLAALTSGDMNADSIALLFQANGISGGQSDPARFTILTQRASGSAP